MDIQISSDKSNQATPIRPKPMSFLALDSTCKTPGESQTAYKTPNTSAGSKCDSDLRHQLKESGQ